MLFKVAICDDEEKDIQAIQRFYIFTKCSMTLISKSIRFKTAQNFWKNMIQQEDTIFSF